MGDERGQGLCRREVFGLAPQARTTTEVRKST
jgi:hypothetical protein